MSRRNSARSIGEEVAPVPSNTGVATRAPERKRTISWGRNISSPERSPTRDNRVDGPIDIQVQAPSATESGESTPIFGGPPGRTPRRFEPSPYYPSTAQHDSHPNYSSSSGPARYRGVPSTDYYSYTGDPYRDRTTHVNQPFLRPFDRGLLMQEDFGARSRSNSNYYGSYPSANVPIYGGRSQSFTAALPGAPGWPWNPSAETAFNPPRWIDAIFDFNSRVRAEPQFLPSGDVPAQIPTQPIGATSVYLPRPVTPPNAYSGVVNFPGYPARQLLHFSNPYDAERTLSNLVNLTTAGDLDRSWVSSIITYEPLLKALLRVTDLVTPVENTLAPKSPCAKVIDMALQQYSPQFLLNQTCTPEMEGSVAMQYIIQKARSSKNPIRIEDIRYYDIVEHALYVMRLSGADSIAAINVIRLVESILPGVHTVGDLQANSLREVLQAVSMILKKRDLRASEEGEEVDPARRIAALHLVSSTIRTYKSLLERSKSTCQTPWMPDEEWVLQDIGVNDVLPYLKDNDAHPFVRCMALRVIRDFGEVGPEDIPGWKNLKDIVKTSVSVLLRQTDWQHGHESKARYLDVVGFSPLDDAYQIIGLSPPETVGSVFSEKLEVETKSHLLEPVLSLIVDHSALKDKHWPSMLMTLIHNGCFSLLHDLLLQPLEQEGGTWQRVACRMRSHACIALTRCFEQIRAKDMNLVPSDLGKTFVSIATDESLPQYLRDSASDALDALNQSIPSSLQIIEMPPKARQTAGGSSEGSSQGTEELTGSRPGSTH
ncbi:hypothetical protein FRC01_005008 [Tulasnella sp. 417]|nr:hypothetical protein FRC01_005008 [Tulasnella sp. 417]